MGCIRITFLAIFLALSATTLFIAGAVVVMRFRFAIAGNLLPDADLAAILRNNMYTQDSAAPSPRDWLL